MVFKRCSTSLSEVCFPGEFLSWGQQNRRKTSYGRSKVFLYMQGDFCDSSEVRIRRYGNLCSFESERRYQIVYCKHHNRDISNKQEKPGLTFDKSFIIWPGGYCETWCEKNNVLSQTQTFSEVLRMQKYLYSIFYIYKQNLYNIYILYTYFLFLYFYIFYIYNICL